MTLTIEDGLELISIADANGVMGENNALKFDLAEKLNEAVSSTPSAGVSVNISIPAQGIQNENEKYNPAQSFTIQAFQQVEEAATIAPYTANETEGQYVISFGSTNPSYLTYTAAAQTIAVVDEDGNKVADLTRAAAITYLEPGTFAMVAANPIVVDITNLPKGKYTINVPAGLFKVYYAATGTSKYFTNGALSFEVEYGTPYTVDLNLELGDDVEGNAWELVTVAKLIDPSEGTTKDLEMDSATLSYVYYEESGLVITPEEGYEVAVTSTPAELAEESVVDMGGYTVIMLSATEDYDNAAFTVTVNKAPVPTTEVTLAYVDGSNGVITEPLWTLVAIAVEELANGSTMDQEATFVKPDKNDYTFSVTPVATLSFEPNDGYTASVVANVDDDTVEVVDGNVTSATIFAGATEVTFTITVNVDDDTTGINGLGIDVENATIYNLQGQKVANPAKGGIYIINGKKVIL